MDSKALLVGVGIGVAATLLLERRGRRRRASARWQDAITVTPRRDRDAPGAAAVPRGQWVDVVDDERLAERVRAALGRLQVDAAAIEVEASDGEVTLRGRIGRAHLESVVSATAAVPGVDAVINQLDTE